MGDLDVASFHGAVVVGALPAFCLHMKWYTISGRIKINRRQIWGDFRSLKRGLVDMDAYYLVPLLTN